MIIHEVEQRSIPWLELRQTRITATKFRTVANGTHEGRETLCWNTAQNRINRPAVVLEMPASQAVQDGVDREPQAIAQYSWERDVEVQAVGFCEYSDYFGFSPDGLVGNEGGVEVKCPTLKTYSQYLKDKLEGKNWIPSEHKWQCKGSLYMSERDWWDYIVYFPDKPLLRHRFEPGNGDFHKIEDGMTLCEQWIKNIEEAKHGNPPS